MKWIASRSCIELFQVLIQQQGFSLYLLSGYMFILYRSTLKKYINTPGAKITLAVKVAVNKGVDVIVQGCDGHL